MPGMSAKQYAVKQALFESLKLLDLPPDTKAIALTKGQYTLVDADDYDLLMQWNWHVNNGYKGSKFYANRALYAPTLTGGRKSVAIRMHNVVITPKEGFEVDHIDGNTLNNKKNNLRLCIHRHNMRNLPKPRNGKTSSPYKGVSWHKDHECWQAMIKMDYKQKWLGNYADPKEAAAAYNEAAIKQFGEFANLNDLETV